MTLKKKKKKKKNPFTNKIACRSEPGTSLRCVCTVSMDIRDDSAA